MPSHLTSVRFDEATLEALKLLADVNGTSVAEEVRNAVQGYITTESASLKDRAEKVAEQRQMLIERLVGSKA